MKPTEWLATYAAALSTFTALQGIWARRRRLSAEIIPSVRSTGQFGYDVTIFNRSGGQVHVSYVGLLVSTEEVTWGQRLSAWVRFRRVIRFYGWTNRGLPRGIVAGTPVTIDPARRHVIFLPHAALLRALDGSDKFAVIVQDELHRNFYSRPYSGLVRELKNAAEHSLKTATETATPSPPPRP